MASFQIKSFLSVTASMVNRLRATTSLITDFNVGGRARTLLEAVAQEIDQLYIQMVNGLRAAIPVAIYTSFGFPAQAAVAAGGPVTLTLAAQATAYTIPATTIATPSGGGSVGFTTVADVLIPAGATSATVTIVANAAGSAGNVPAGTTFALGASPPGLVSAVAVSAIANGLDAETDDAHKIRFAAYVATLARSPVAGLYRGLKSTQLVDASGNVLEQVVSAQVVEPYETDNTQPVGLINCYVHNGVGSTSDALVAQALAILVGYRDALGNKVPGYKAAGTHVTVAAATEQVVNVSAVLTAAPGYAKATLQPIVGAAIQAYILGLPIGVTCILAEVTELAMSTPGVANFVLSAPAADVPAGTGIKLMPGTVTPS